MSGDIWPQLVIFAISSLWKFPDWKAWLYW